MRVSSAASSDPQFTPMRTGLWFSMATSIMVRKLSSVLRPMFALPGLMRLFGQRAGALGILLQQDVAVIVEVADDGHARAELVQRVNDPGHGGGRLLGVDGDADQLRAGARPAPSPGSRWKPRRRYRCWSMDCTTMGCSPRLHCPTSTTTARRRGLTAIRSPPKSATNSTGQDTWRSAGGLCRRWGCPNRENTATRSPALHARPTSIYHSNFRGPGVE